ncbi:MAG: hypothetical protein HZC29_08810 [Thaumarchaeota archaeon]|nr:hypothetical protein [Nitrososphaerota archaeon]
MNVGISCICCEKADRPEKHVNCTSIQLMLLKNQKDEPFFSLESAKRNCVCFANDEPLHITIVEQLRKQNHQPTAKIEFKPLPSQNGLKTQIPKSEYGRPINRTMSDFDEVKEDVEEDLSEVEDLEQ